MSSRVRHLIPLFALAMLVVTGSAEAARHSSNVCNGPHRSKLRCPDLRIAPPHDFLIDYSRPGRTLLRATSDVESRGLGPIELHGRRSKPGWMTVEQAIYRKRGGRLFLPTRARLHFFDVGYQWGGSYWKVRDPVRFELWRLDHKGKKKHRVRIGPKQFYCLRDLEQTRPGKRSPGVAVYPGCNQNPLTKSLVLGTSVGWSDIYPSTYDQQFINVQGLRGCFAYVLRVDPRDFFAETHEGNNVSQKTVRLPFHGKRHGC